VASEREREEEEEREERKKEENVRCSLSYVSHAKRYGATQSRRLL
jgi:hypothetical protein